MASYSITIAHSILTLADCEAVVDWTGVGSSTVALDTDDGDYWKGKGGILITENATAPANLAYTGLNNLDLSSYDTVLLWVRPNGQSFSAGDLRLVFDNDAALASIDKTINLPALTNGTVQRIVLSGEDFSTITSASSMGIRMNDDPGAFSLNIDDIVICKSMDFDMLSLKGFTDGDMSEPFPNLHRRRLNGARDVVRERFSRVCHLRLSSIDTAAKRQFLQEALTLHPSFRLLYSDDEVEGCWEGDVAELQWVGGFSGTKAFDGMIYEKVPFWRAEQKPPSWS